MRIIVFLVSLSLSVLVSTAQTQQGYTKTVGKENKPGEPLSGVTVRINGNINSVLSDENGHFSFPVISKQFKVSRVAKKGYELADPDIVGQPYGITYNTPFVIPFISTEELRRIIYEIEDKTKQKYADELEKKDRELQYYMDLNKLSQEEYDRKLAELLTKYEDLEGLIEEMAKRYAFTDYDNIDSTNLIINQAIEQGDIELAVQLINSKGSFEDRFKEIEEEENLGIRLSQEAQAKKADLAADRKQLAKIHFAQHHYDSTYIFMEQRYLVDTTSVSYLYELVFEYPFMEYSFKSDQRTDRRNRHIRYLQKLRQHISEVATLLDVDTLIVGANIESKLADIYSYRLNAIEHYKKAYSMRLQAKDDYAWEELEKIGRLYKLYKLNEEAYDVYQEALNNCKSPIGKTNLYIQIADLYSTQGDDKRALKKYMLAEQEAAKTVVLGEEDDIDSRIFLDYELFVIQGYIAQRMANEGQKKKAISYGDKAIHNAIRQYEHTNRNSAIIPIIALYKQQFKVYNELKNNKKMQECAEGAVNYANLYMQRMPSSKSQLLYAESLSLLADAHAYLGLTDIAQNELIECLKKGEFAGNVYKARYATLCTNVYSSFAICFSTQKQYENALHAIDKAISISEETNTYQRKYDILLKMGEKEEAKAVEQHMIELLKNSRTAYLRSLSLYDELFELQL